MKPVSKTRGRSNLGPLNGNTDLARDNEAELANILVKLQHLLQERVGSGSYCLGSRLRFAWELPVLGGFVSG